MPTVRGESSGRSCGECRVWRQAVPTHRYAKQVPRHHVSEARRARREGDAAISVLGH